MFKRLLRKLVEINNSRAWLGENTLFVQFLQASAMLLVAYFIFDVIGLWDAVFH